MIRALQESDLDQIKEIHEKYYKHEFSLSEFSKKFFGSFVAIQNDKIVVMGGVRTIAEVVLVTNKDLSVRTRRDALYDVLGACVHITKKAGYEHLHAFVQENSWEKQLKRTGFKDCVGNALVIGVE